MSEVDTPSEAPSPTDQLQARATKFAMHGASLYAKAAMAVERLPEKEETEHAAALFEKAAETAKLARSLGIRGEHSGAARRDMSESWYLEAAAERYSKIGERNKASVALEAAARAYDFTERENYGHAADDLREAARSTTDPARRRLLLAEELKLRQMAKKPILSVNAPPPDLLK